MDSRALVQPHLCKTKPLQQSPRLDPLQCLRVAFRDPLLDRIIQIIKIHGAN